MTQKDMFGHQPEVGDQSDIQWDSYIKQVQLFYNGRTFAEFQAACEKLALRYGTANPTDTVLEALKREAYGDLSQVCQDCDGKNQELCSYERCPKKP